MLNKSPSRSLIKAVFNAYNSSRKEDGPLTVREEKKTKNGK
jgi:hypothetical protein